MRVALVGQMTVPAEYSTFESALNNVKRSPPILLAREKAAADVVIIVIHLTTASRGLATMFVCRLSTPCAPAGHN